MPNEKIKSFKIINPGCNYIFVGSSTTKHSKEMGYPYINKITKGNRNRSPLWVILDKYFYPQQEGEFGKIEKEYRNASEKNRKKIKCKMNEVLKNCSIGLMDMVKSCRFNNDVGKNNDANINLNRLKYNKIKKLKSDEIVLIINGGENPSDKKEKLITGFLEQNKLNNIVGEQIININCLRQMKVTVEKIPNIFGHNKHSEILKILKSIFN